ncbi:MAG: hypothetical protein K2M95_03230 [Clostridiales bacterium]|nr:hypothetical protein [Clostridiales bacterium]
MVSSRRRVVTEQDRYGGFGVQPMVSRAPVEKEEPVHTFSFDDRFAPSVDVREERAEAVTQSRRADLYAPTEVRQAQQPPVIEYSTRPYTGLETYTPTQRVTVRHEKAAKREREELMPSIKQRVEAAEAEEVQTRVKLSSRTKVYLGIYLTVAAILAVLVIATGLAVSNINGTADRLQSQIAAQNEVLAAQNAEILRLTDTDRITGAAVNNGMQKVENATKVELLPVSEPMVYEGRTNWFDRFCDWLSNLIGG